MFFCSIFSVLQSVRGKSMGDIMYQRPVLISPRSYNPLAPERKINTLSSFESFFLKSEQEPNLPPNKMVLLTRFKITSDLKDLAWKKYNYTFLLCSDCLFPFSSTSVRTGRIRQNRFFFLLTTIIIPCQFLFFSGEHKTNFTPQ